MVAEKRVLSLSEIGMFLSNFTDEVWSKKELNDLQGYLDREVEEGNLVLNRPLILSELYVADYLVPAYIDKRLFVLNYIIKNKELSLKLASFKRIEEQQGIIDYTISAMACSYYGLDDYIGASELLDLFKPVANDVFSDLKDETFLNRIDDILNLIFHHLQEYSVNNISGEENFFIFDHLIAILTKSEEFSKKYNAMLRTDNEVASYLDNLLYKKTNKFLNNC